MTKSVNNVIVCKLVFGFSALFFLDISAALWFGNTLSRAYLRLISSAMSINASGVLGSPLAICQPLVDPILRLD